MSVIFQGLQCCPYEMCPVKLLLAVACLTCWFMLGHSNMCLRNPESSLPDALCLTLCIQGVAAAHVHSYITSDP